ncbi:MAG: DMT family transporter [Streptosporangiaceae bacterium]
MSTTRRLPLPGALPLGPALVTVGAVLWGTDALMRLPLAQELPAATVVFGEHILLVLLTLPWLPGAVRAAARAGWRTVLAVAVIGVGSSAVATILFTQAFTYGDAVTPLLLQKLQPIVAVAAAAVLLGERPRRSYGLYFVAAFVSAWLLAFPSPLSVGASRLIPALLAVGAAVLWAAGTVLGRYASLHVTASQVTSLRFAGGLVGSGIWVAATSGTSGPAIAPRGDWLGIVLLALVPGLIALQLYYRGLQSTPASVATLCELAFPLTAAIVGVAVLGTSLTAGQWVGAGMLAAVVVLLGFTRSGSRTVDRPGVAARGGPEQEAA